jgi:hypothetical protein
VQNLVHVCGGTVIALVVTRTNRHQPAGHHILRVAVDKGQLVLCRACCERETFIVFSPITMTHPIDNILAKDKITLGSEYWVRFDELFMKACSRMVVLMIDGWKESQGIKREMEFFKAMGKDVEYLNPSTMQTLKEMHVQQDRQKKHIREAPPKRG